MIYVSSEISIGRSSNNVFRLATTECHHESFFTKDGKAKELGGGGGGNRTCIERVSEVLMSSR